MTQDLQAGSVIGGKYIVERLLGQGGMGNVYAAKNDLLDQRVAIKLLHQGLRDGQNAQRFHREGRAAAKVRGEHAVRVLDVGADPEHGPFMVLEFLEGEDLEQRLARQRVMQPPEAARYLVQACEALAEIHAAGIVHRDLKPSNMFLSRRPDGSEAVKVLDFGISKVQGESMTSSVAVLGTVYYMSPEQLQAAKNVDARSDIWALGAILYQLTTGVVPFNGDQLAHVVAAVLQLSYRRPRELKPDYPPQLEAVVVKALTPNPHERFADVQEFAEALRPFVPVDCLHHLERIARLTPGRRPSSHGVSARASTVGPVTPAEWPTPQQMQNASSDSLPYIASQPSGRTFSPSSVSTAKEGRKRTGIVVGAALAAMIVFGGGGTAYHFMGARPSKSSGVTSLAQPTNEPEPTTSAEASESSATAPAAPAAASIPRAVMTKPPALRAPSGPASSVAAVAAGPVATVPVAAFAPPVASAPPPVPKPAKSNPLDTMEIR